MLGAGRCWSVGGRAGLGQPGRGARATPKPVWCGGHVDGGRVDGRSKQSSPVPVALSARVQARSRATFVFVPLLFPCPPPAP